MKCSQPSGRLVMSCDGSGKNPSITSVWFSRNFEIAGTLQMHLDFWIARREATQFRDEKDDAQPIGHAEPDDAFGLALFGPEIAGDREKPLIKPQQFAVSARPFSVR